jgi:hypothetical protein
MHQVKDMQDTHEVNRYNIPYRGCRSLLWSGDELVDWVSGGRRITLDKRVTPPLYNYAYRFDSAIASVSKEYVALYERLGTKGLLLRSDGTRIREIARSYYHANAYEYPIAFLTLPDGRPGLAHCPQSYARLEIEEVESGMLLTQRETVSPDFFHSRLAVSVDNQYLLDAGWIWHPFDMIQVYELSRVFAEPASLDGTEGRLFPVVRTGVGINNAAFLAHERIVFTTNDVFYDPGDVDEDEQALLEPGVLAVYDVREHHRRSSVPLEEPAGMLMPVGEDFVIGFYEHPKLIEVTTGKVVMRWPEIESGTQNSSIIWSNTTLPPIALDPQHQRFAVASAEAITVIELR